MKRFTKLLLLAIMLLTTAIGAVAKSTMDSYYMQRASEEMNAGNVEAALSYFQKELEENPTNAYAHMGLATIYNAAQEYGKALTSINTALQNLSKKENPVRTVALTMRSDINLILDETEAALTDLNEAIRLSPAYADAYTKRADIYCDQGLFDQARADYAKAAELNPGCVAGRMGLGRVAYSTGELGQAVEQYTKVLAFEPTNAQALLMRARSYLGYGDYVNVLEDVCAYSAQSFDEDALRLVAQFPPSYLPVLVARFSQIKDQDPYILYPYLLIERAYFSNGKYAEAIETLKSIPFYSSINNPYVPSQIAYSYYNSKDYANALVYFDQALALDPDNYNYNHFKAEILAENGREREAIDLYTKCITLQPTDAEPYYQRAFVEDNINESEQALSDYEVVCTLLPDFAYAHLGRGDMLERLGRHEEALEAYQRVVQLDTVPNENSCAMYALLALNRREEAVAFMQRLLEALPDASSTYYEAACFYCRLGQPQQALQYLSTALGKDYNRFCHIRRDDDLEALRQMPEFEQLMQQYEPSENPIARPAHESDHVDTVITEPVEIPFTRDGAMIKVDCVVNGLPLNFILDTGASAVTISPVEANFMMKNGYLKQSDITGSTTGLDAVGNVTEGTIINLRQITLGSITLNNISATVIHSQKAPILLGQTFFDRVGNIEIDNRRSILIIHPN